MWIPRKGNFLMWHTVRVTSLLANTLSTNHAVHDVWVCLASLFSLDIFSRKDVLYSAWCVVKCKGELCVQIVYHQSDCAAADVCSAAGGGNMNRALNCTASLLSVLCPFDTPNIYASYIISTTHAKWGCSFFVLQKFPGSLIVFLRLLSPLVHWNLLIPGTQASGLSHIWGKGQISVVLSLSI